MSLDKVLYKKIGNKKIFIYKSHRLLEYRNNYPFYDRALPRICKSLKDIDGHLTMIDIGANIGDTVSLVSDLTYGNFLCIEGDKKYLPLLKKNIQKFKNNYIEIEESYCNDGNNSQYIINNYDGTAQLVESSEEKIENFRTLDQIITIHPKFKSNNILKIDTDGFEINVIKGAISTIKKNNPVLFIEYTPELYLKLHQNPDELIKIIYKLGYENALFYDNY